MKGITDTVLMIRPLRFGPNEETMLDNAFQTKAEEGTSDSINDQALKEFDGMVDLLRKNDIKVIVKEAITEKTPDALFPNNWFSTHANGSIATYPMKALSRRIERREDLVTELSESMGYKKRYGFEYHEEQELFLEGTGSMILDRDNKIVYACLSQRTNIKVLEKFCVLYAYQKFVFNAVDENGSPIYHTNVLMALGTDYVVICLDSIESPKEKKELTAHFERTGKEIVEISMEQMNAFAGNMLQVKSGLGEKFLIMSRTAYASLTEVQVAKLKSFNKLLTPSIPTIEKYGGGSVRCMLAEIFGTT